MDRDAPGSPNLKEINRRLDRLERNSYLSINAISENAFADITSAYEDVSLSAGEYENSETRKFEDRTLSDSRKLIELLEKKQEESLQEIRELTDQTREMTDVSEGENFRIQLWQKYLMQETSSIASNDEHQLELFAGLSDADLNDVLSDAGLSDVLSDPPGMLSHFCDEVMKLSIIIICAKNEAIKIGYRNFGSKQNFTKTSLKCAFILLDRILLLPWERSFACSILRRSTIFKFCKKLLMKSLLIS